MKTSTKNIQPYTWGDNCQGWKLLDHNELSVIEEIMPPNTAEVRHYHQSAQQYFYILEGEAYFFIASKAHLVKANEGIYIPNNTLHFIQNRSNQTIRFLVISNPTTKGDRIENERPLLFNYHNKYFKSIQNTENGEVSGDTLFHYRQKGKTIWATYEGGQIEFGMLSGTVDEKGELYFRYQHQNTEGEWKSGKCHSVPIVLENGKIQLTEYWQWTTDDLSKGQSIIREV